MNEPQSNLFQDFNEPQPATTGQRIVNYIIDLIAFYAIIFVVGFILGAALPEMVIADSPRANLYWYLVAIVVILLYYTLTEGSTGKSLGKVVTKTKVLSESGDKISYKDAFMRSLSRLVPFEFLSVFGGRLMWHDSWTKTQVVKDR